MILAIDQGTTGTTCLVFDEQAEPIGRAYREFEQHFPRPGWVEHDALEIWEVSQAVAGEALADAGLRPGELTAVGIANQRETVCVWDPATGEPLHRAIVWQDRRTAARCDELRAAGHEPLVRSRTGLVLDPYFSATKIQWLLEHVEGLRERALSGRAVFGTVDSWLSFKLTGEHVTDVSNASRTMLFDISARSWDPELLELLGVPERAMPRVLDSAGVLGETLPEALHGHAVPLAGVAGDQQAALFGQACVEQGMGKNTYGTGSFVLLNTGFTVPRPPAGLLATVAWGIGGATSYALEASIFVTGAAVQWLRDGLGIIEHAAEVEGLQRRRLLRAGAHRPRLAALGPLRARHDRGADPRRRSRASRARGARGDRLPDARRARGDAGGLGTAAERAACGRRGQRQRLADAVPGGHAWRSRGAARDHRDDRARGGLPGGRGHRAVDRERRTRRLARAPAL
jgi:glycerol kinase